MKKFSVRSQRLITKALAANAKQIEKELPSMEAVDQLRDFLVEKVQEIVEGQQTGLIRPLPSKIIELDEQMGAFDGFGSMLKGVEMMTTFSTEVHSLMVKVRDIVTITSDTTFQEALMLRLERTIVFVFAMFYSDDPKHLMTHAYMYLSAYWDRSMVDMIWKQLDHWRKEFQAEADVQLEELGHQTGALCGDLFDGGLAKNWKKIVKGAFGKHIGRIITLLLSMGVLPEKAGHWMVQHVYKSLDVQHPRYMKEDIFEYMFSIIDWLITAVWPAWSTANPNLLFMDSTAEGLDQAYAKVVTLARRWDLGMHDELSKEGIVHDAEIVSRIDDCVLAHMARMKMAEGAERNIFQSRILSLQKLADGMRASWKKAKLREKPYAVLLRGASSVGKSTVAGIIAHVVGLINEFPQGDKYQVTLNGMDKYQSEYLSHHLIVLIDDLCNTRAEREEGNPLFKLIQFINNVHCAALKADVDSKAKVDIRCKLVIVTTNTKDLNATYFSVSPASIMRRFDLVLDVSVKEECKGPNGSIHPRYKENSLPNVWDFIAQVVVVKEKSATYELRKLEISDIVDLIDYLQKETPTHYSMQEAIVESSKDMHLKEHCPAHPLFILPCAACAKIGIDPASEAYQWERCDDNETSKEADDKLGHQGGVMSAPTDVELFNEAFHDCIPGRQEMVEDANPPLRLKDLLPEWLSTKRARLDAYQEFMDNTEALHRQALEMRDRAQKELKATDMTYRCVFALAVIMGTGMCFRKMTNLLTEQGSVISKIEMKSATPKQMVDVQNAYAKPFRLRPDFPTASISTSVGDFHDKVTANMHVAYVSVLDPISKVKTGDTNWCNTVPVGNGKWLFPKHMFRHGDLFKVECHTMDPKLTIGTKHIVEMICQDQIGNSDTTDLAEVRLIRGGSCWDMSKYCWNGDLNKIIKIGDAVHLYHRHMNSLSNFPVDPCKEPIAAVVTDVGTFVSASNPYKGVKYRLNDAQTFNGLCGALVVKPGKNPVVVGFHVAGNRNVGACCPYDKNDFKEVSGVDIANETSPPNERLGKQFSLSEEVSAKSPVHWMGTENVHSMEILGQHDVATSHFKSEVRNSIIAEQLEFQLGISVKHAGPKARYKTVALNKFLDNASKVLPPPDPRFLRWACDDLKIKIEEFLGKCPTFIENTNPLDYKTAVNGMDGVKGYDPLNVNTSMGWPLNCAKFKMLVEEAITSKLSGGSAKIIQLDDTVGEDAWSLELVFDPEKCDVKEHVEHLLSELSEGRRAGVIFRANFKDEPLPIEKVNAGKIRIFCGATVDLVVACRMMLLSLYNNMTYYPGVFESAVGVNAQGKDWIEIYNIITKYSTTRIVAGDYGNFDQSQRPEFTVAAWELKLHILSLCNYDELMLKTVKGLATENCFPMLEFNGTLIKLFGIQPSGQPGTVVSNGLVNCLYMRYAYYALHYQNSPRDLSPANKQIPLFHEVISLITYGDDNIAGVSEKELLWNHSSVADVMASIGIKYTMADKGAASRPFIDISEASFLKRSFVVHPVLQEIVGPLEVDSINKSLTVARKSGKRGDETEAQIMAMNMRSALIYCWFHSPEMYERYAKAFETMLHTQDAVGDVIANHYKLVTPLEIQEAYYATYTCYPDALKLVEQSGTVLTLSERRASFHESILCERDVLKFVADVQKKSVEQVYFEQLSLDLERDFNNRQRQRRQVKRNAERIHYLYEVNSDVDDVAIEPKFAWSRLTMVKNPMLDVRVYNIFQKLEIRNTLHDLPDEIVRKVIEYSIDTVWCLFLSARDGSLINYDVWLIPRGRLFEGEI